MLSKAQQLRAISKEMVANGFTNVQIACPARDVGIPVDVVLDITAMKMDSGRECRHIIEMLDRDRSFEEGCARHDMISEAIADKPEIEYTLRVYDDALDMANAWSKLRKQIGAKIKNGEDVAALEGVLDMMDGLKAVFGGR
jgi:hypothetical protein